MIAQIFSRDLNGYYYDVLIKVGINILLAVSLNLINGYTGQFSLGHAGFMAVGAYSSAAVTMFLGPKILPHGTGPMYDLAPWILFLMALIIGGLAGRNCWRVGRRVHHCA